MNSKDFIGNCHTEILIAEDSRAQAEKLRCLLQSRGFKVTETSNGREALHTACRYKPDLIISDIVMPEMNGYELCASIKQDEALKDVPVMLLSALSGPKDILQGLEVGVDYYLTKPYDEDFLLSKIESVFSSGLTHQAQNEPQELTVRYAGENHNLKFDSQRVLNLLLCTYENAVQINNNLLQTRSELKRLNQQLEDKVKKRTAKLAAEISEHKRTEAALRESEERLRTIIDSVEAGIVIIDPETHLIIDANPRAARMIGVSREHLIGCGCHANICPAEKGKCPIADLGQVVDNAEQILLADNGESIPILKTVVPIRLKGRKCLLESFIDIKKWKHTEEEKQKLEAQLRQVRKMEAIGNLAGGIAHDFNNILTPLMVRAEMSLLDITGNSPVSLNLKEILKAGNRAKDLVKQILTFSRQNEQKLCALKIGPVVEEVLKLIRASLPATIEIRSNADAGHDTVFADPTQIHQVIMNLCTNAARAMGDNGGVLEVSLENLEFGLGNQISSGAGISEYESQNQQEKTELGLSPGNYLRLTVRDTGCGIEKSVMERIFEPYFTTQDKGEGTGLGLAVVHGIVTSIGGEISVESNPGKGTAFHVFFPVFEGEPLPEVQNNSSLSTGSERILIVDDEKMIVDTLQLMLERLGYHVTVRTSSVEALEAFRADPARFDLVITDQTMPNMTGVKLSEELLKIVPGIKIILCTGFGAQVNENKALTSGIDAFIMKPIVMKEMAQTIRDVLDG